ncbi:hypothetical protein STAS_03955 [Striga asiatica]|uniref:Uncharacterized protein n=1 Tax=Striga asiatica TaxID=4170 RepID=A0A5A7P5G4_STRAF|nr:hypothetical protein STAS_03955 [Striga asiatica]
MIASRSFCGISPCIEETVKLFSRIFAVSQSTCQYTRHLPSKSEALTEIMAITEENGGDGMRLKKEEREKTCSSDKPYSSQLNPLKSQSPNGGEKQKTRQFIRAYKSNTLTTSEEPKLQLIIAEKHVLGGLGVNNLTNSERNHGRLARTRLRLCDDVTAGDDREHRPLLNGGGLLETVIVNTSEEIVLNPHLVEAHDRLDALRRLEDKLRVGLLHRPPRTTSSLNRRRHAARTPPEEVVSGN